eukprot:NODE_732_length_4716_cov_0.429500.p1 type:complete len:493 gc:universal NODE_732_length_4716_cov_0.429500:3409-1931(-)
MTLKKLLDISLILNNIDDPIYCLDYLVNWNINIEEIESLDLDAHTDLYQQLYKLKPTESSVFGKHYYRLLVNFFTKSPTETTLIWHYLQGFSNNTHIYDDEDLFGYFINVIEYFLRNDGGEGPLLPISTPSMYINELDRVYNELLALNKRNNNLWNYCMYLCNIQQNKDSSQYLHRMGGYIPKNNNNRESTQILFGLMLNSIHDIAQSLATKNKHTVLKDVQISLENIKSKSKDLQIADYEYTATRLSEIAKQLYSCESFADFFSNIENIQFYLQELAIYCNSYSLQYSVQQRQVPSFFKTFYKHLSNDYRHRTCSIDGSVNDRLLNCSYFMESCELIVYYFSEYSGNRILIQLYHIIAIAIKSGNMFLKLFSQLATTIIEPLNEKGDAYCRLAIAHGDGLLKCMAYITRGIVFTNYEELEIGFKLQMIGLNEFKKYSNLDHTRLVFIVLFECYLDLLQSNDKLSISDKIKYVEKKSHLVQDIIMVDIPRPL